MIQLIFCYLQKRKKLSLRIESASSLYPLHYACWNSSTEVALYILTQDLEQAKIIVEGAGEFIQNFEKHMFEFFLFVILIAYLLQKI